MRLKMFEGPIQKQVNDKAEYAREIPLERVDELCDKALAPVLKEDPALARVIKNAAVENVVIAVRQSGGVFSLKALEGANDSINIAQSGLAKLASGAARSEEFQDRMKVAQLGTALLAKVLIEWVNAGRPDPVPERSMALSPDKIREQAVAQGVSADDQRYLEAFLGAFAKAHPGEPLTMREIKAFQEEIAAAEKPLKLRQEARESASLPRDRELDGEVHQYVLQSLGAYRLNDLVGFFATQGEMAKIAADVKPGAGQAFADAV